jgi:triphosphatase
MKTVAPASTTNGHGNKPLAPPTRPDKETELKFVATEATFKALQRSDRLGPVARTERLQSTYYDTEAGDLRLHRVALRMRKTRAGHILTVKFAGDPGQSPFERSEIEAVAPTPVPQLDLLGPQVEAQIQRLTGGRPLLASFTTNIRRSRRLVQSAENQIEAAFDTGTITAGERRQPVREIELELKSGDPASLYQLGLSLMDDYQLQLSPLTKSQRGVLLSSGQPATFVRAEALDLAGCTVDQAIGAVINTCLVQFIANWPAFDGPHRPEAIHQMRVAMRRLRAALALFHRKFPCSEFTELRGEAKRIASAMGDARNWDVFDELVRKGPRGTFVAEPGFDSLIASAHECRGEGHQVVEALLAEPATTRFILAVQSFVARRAWRNALPGADLRQLTEPVAGFAADCLDRLHRRVRKRGRKLLQLAPEERHEVRIALKNLRYAADFFGKLFQDSRHVRSYVQAAAKLQDTLGSYNDMIMIMDQIRRIDAHDLASARAAGIIVGWYGHAATNNDAALQESWNRFRKADCFWPNPPQHDRKGAE